MTARTKGVHLGSSKATISVPESMAAGPADIFVHLVGSVDPTHFSEVDLPLLEQYAVAAFQATVAAQEIEKTGAVVDGKASPWLVVQEKSVRALTALSARLRICPQSRFDRLVAGANSRKQLPTQRDDADGPDPLDEFTMAR